MGGAGALLFIGLTPHPACRPRGHGRSCGPSLGLGLGLTPAQLAEALVALPIATPRPLLQASHPHPSPW